MCFELRLVNVFVAQEASFVLKICKITNYSGYRVRKSLEEEELMMS